MPRVKKEPVVIPTTSLVASAVRYDGKSARIYQPNQNWQAECYRHFAICGEARFASKFVGHALSRATLGIATPSKDGPVPVENGPAVDALDALFNGKDGQAQMLDALGTHLTIAGECYLVGRAVDGEDVWEIVSILEMRVQGSRWAIHYGEGVPDVPLTDSDVVIRIWLPNPARRIEADSPFRSLLPILTEIEWLTRHIFAQTSSRLAGAGLLMLPQGMSFPPPPSVDGQPQQTANEADAFMLTLADAMLQPISDPSSPSAMVPIVVTAPDDSIDKAKLMHFWSELDSNALAMRSEAIRRFALGMDMPPEQVLGMHSSGGGTGGGRSTGVSHWGAWQIEEATIKMHIEPMLELVANSLTIGYLRPLLGDSVGDQAVVYDSSTLRLRPDRSKEAMELYDRGLLSGSVLLRENGFAPEDLPSDDEFKTWLLRKVASGSATPEQVAAACKALGVDLGPVGPPAETNQTPPAPTIKDHPVRDIPSAAVLHSCEALVLRALERAGNRLRANGQRPPGVPASETHVYVRANGNAAFCLDDAWSSAPQVLAGLVPVESTVEVLDSYCKTLLAEQSPHTRARLNQWLSLNVTA